MNRILVPVDFSDTSLNALTYATKLFRGSALEITVLHTYKVMSSGAFSMKMKTVERVMEEDAQREMDALLKRMRDEEPDITVKSELINSDAIPSIISLGDSGTYDYIVMGTNGASGLKEVFIGSVAGGVISKTKAPVLVVPGNYKFRPLEEIVLAFSGTSLSNSSSVEPLRNLAKMHSSKINILHVTEEEKPDLGEVANTLKDINPTITYAFGTGNINERLNEYMLKEGAGLLCLVRRKKDFFTRIIGGSVTLKQTFNSSTPLLILKD